MYSVSDALHCSSAASEWRCIPAAPLEPQGVIDARITLRPAVLAANGFRRGALTAIYSRKLTQVERDLPAAHEALYRIGELPDNWTDNGAPAFSASFVAKARDLLAKLPHVPFIMPTASPSIQMSFEHLSAGYLQLDLFEDGPVEYYREYASGDVAEDELSWDQVPQAVDNFFGGLL